MYRVRVLAREGEAAAEARDVGAVVKERLLTARDARRAIGLPNANTDTYRCVVRCGDTVFCARGELLVAPLSTDCCRCNTKWRASTAVVLFPSCSTDHMRCVHKK